MSRLTILPLVALLLATACGGEPVPAASPDVPLFPIGNDTKSGKADVQQPPADTAEELPDGTEEPELPPPSEVVAVLAEAATVVELGAKVPLTVTIERPDGEKTAPKTKETLIFRMDGVPLAAGATLVADPAAQPAVSVWKGAEPGKFWLAGVRPGKAEVTVEVAGVVSAPLTVETSWPAQPLVRMSHPKATGITQGERVQDAADTVQLSGKTFGAGGLTITLRFPLAATAGAAYDLEKPPKGATLSIKGTLGDLGGQQITLLKGRIWIDQTDKGLFRGSFLGTSADLQPAAGVFVVERKGDFGVDVLDDGLQVATSTSPKPATGSHVSRAAVHAVGGGLAVLTYRTILNVTTADLTRVLIDAKTGEIDGSLAPLVTKAPAWKDPPGEALPAVGYTSAAISAGKLLMAWEGRSGKGVALPDRVWAQVVGSDHAPVGAPIAIADDACHGQCRVQVLRLPNSRWLVLWSAPNGEGVRVRQVLGDLTLDPPDGPMQLVAAPATSASAAVLDQNLAVLWRTPQDGTHFRMFLDDLASNGPEQSLGSAVANPQAPAVATVEAQPSFLALFFSPPGELKMRRLSLAASKMGPADAPVVEGVTRILAAAGKNGQVAIVERLQTAGQDAKAPQLRVRKIQVTGPGDYGTPLGAPIELAAKGKLVLEPSLTYVPEADVFVVAWSGDVQSESVWIQRFR